MEVMQSIRADLPVSERHTTKFVGHNIVGFDLPALWFACLRNQVPYHSLPFPRGLKPWDTHTCIDTLWQLSGGNFKGYSLAKMAKLFGLESKMPDVDGSMVWSMYKQNLIEAIVDYCEDDVRLVRQLHKRMEGYL